ncbi:multidrug effflux MFS transporter [Ferrimonas sediminicola]|uniref:Multidrug effflux MFS transporter n=1 Tax=Ferrimonas sediminicola TaxID=2569538 RepID=A0A4U1BC22_9GAMM|nr:MFS transporter [Ferrimonas sediminicola]TKB48548.1 multidrug effflux MFS transporter [Ferrimonas sediminicola]
MTLKRPATGLVVALMMFPLVVETIYSPALPGIAEGFAISASQASHTMSVYFIAFALGVLAWGVFADLIGRRASMLAGLSCYALGAVLALLAPDYLVLLLARGLSAFGAAAGSVVSQTILRDRFRGTELARVFSLMGGAIALGPAVGLGMGSLLVSLEDYSLVFWALAALSLILLMLSATGLPETLEGAAARVSLTRLARAMARDGALWCDALLVSLFNLMVFGYYALAPFLFQQMGMEPQVFGRSGVVLALGTALGSLLNRRFVTAGVGDRQLVIGSSMLALTAGLMLVVLQHSLWFLLPMMLVVLAFGAALPNILSRALRHYSANAGSAAALFGLAYYMMLGGGLALTAWGQNLGVTVSLSGVLALAAAAVRR